MVQNTKNTSASLNPVIEEVLSILWIEKKGFKAIPGDYRQTINTILWEWDNSTNKALALYLIQNVDVSYFHRIDKTLRQDKQVVLAALWQKSSIFKSLTPKYQLDYDCWVQTIKSMIRERINFLEVETFLNSNFKNVKVFERLLKFYTGYLKVADYIFQSETEKQLVAIKTNFPDIYDLILSKGIIQQKEKKIVLTLAFIKHFLEQVATPMFITLSPEEQKLFQVQICREYLWLPEKQISPEIQLFLESLVDLVSVKKHTKAQEEKEEKKVEIEEDIDDEQEHELETRLDFCIPPCHYTALDNGSCDIHVGADIRLNLDEKEMDSISNRALQNYISAVKKLTYLGFWFAFRNQEQFFRIMDVDPIYGEWLSEWKVLKILNKVGKKIGIPEKIISEWNPEMEEKKETQVGCFDSVEEASLRFRDIAKTGKVNDDMVIDPGKKWDKSILRHVLEQRWLYDVEGKWFLVARWV